MAKPATIRRLRDAGVVDLRTSIAAGLVTPWLIGRGPSLGIISQINRWAIGSKPGIHDRSGASTHADLDSRANRLARALLDRGLKPGDRVALVLRNGREFLETIIACHKAGLVVCPLNTWAKARELESLLNDLEPSALIFDVRHRDQLPTNTDGIPLIAVDSPGEEDMSQKEDERYEDLLASSSGGAMSPFTTSPGSARTVIQTSGTTGKPKGAERTASDATPDTLANLLGRVPYRRDDVVVCPAPLFHSFGMLTTSGVIGVGGTLVLPDRFHPEGTLELIDHHRATAASLVPVMIRRIVSLSDEVKQKYDLSTLRIVLASGSLLSRDLRMSAVEMFGDVIYDLYGSTEAGWVAIATPEDIRRHPDSVGRIVPGVEVAVFSTRGDRLPIGKTGELHIKGPVVFEGYVSDDSRETNAEPDDPRRGYLPIGDVGRIDEEGYLYLKARADEMVVIGGENVYPIEVEQVIQGIDGVHDAAVVGIPDEEYGQVLAAFVSGNVDEAEVRSVCESELSSFKVPRRIEVVDDLPRTSTGKILKKQLLGLIDKEAG